MLIALAACVGTGSSDRPSPLDDSRARDTSVESQEDSGVSAPDLSTSTVPRNPHRRTWLAVAVGPQHACGQNPDRTLTCWGTSMHVDSIEPSIEIAEVALGSGARCMTDLDGELWCHSSVMEQLSPTNARGLSADGAVACWASSEDGAGCEYLPSGNPVSKNIDAVPDETFLAIDVSRFAACGVLADGSLTCWGDDPLSDAEVPSGVFTDVGVGTFHACALNEVGGIECWGGAHDPDYDRILEPPEGQFIDLSIQSYMACAVRVDGLVSCWGWQYSWTGVLEPPTNARFKSVDKGGGVGCGVTRSDEIRCWGNEGNGVLDVPE